MGIKVWHYFLEIMLIEKRQFSQIRVGEICKKANIHRSTFYRHFEDKYQLLEYGLGILWHDYFELDEDDKFLMPFQTATSFFQESTAEKLIKRNKTDDEFIKLVDGFFLRKMKESFTNCLKQENLTGFPKELLSLYMVSSIQAIDEWQSSEKQNITSKELDEIYQKLVLKVLKVV